MTDLESFLLRFVAYIYIHKDKGRLDMDVAQGLSACFTWMYGENVVKIREKESIATHTGQREAWYVWAIFGSKQGDCFP